MPHKLPNGWVRTTLGEITEPSREQALVDSNRELIARFEKKMQAKLAEIWGKEASKPELTSGR